MAQITVWQAFYDVLRQYGMTTMFGNPGSTEETMLANFPADFKYVLGLQEATVVAMADGWSQANGRPAVVSLHGAAGTGNAMASIFGAAMNKTPLLLIAGQQHRDMLLGEPFLTNRQETNLPKPWVKWAYQPVHAKDVPAAVVRAISIASMPPQGPVYLSIPLDDWAQVVQSTPVPRLVSTRIAPDPAQLSIFAARLRQARKPALIYGQEVDRSLAWEAAIQLSELIGAATYQAPYAERAVFPECHPLFAGALPPAMGPLSAKLEGHDLLLVVGAEVFRYYPYVAGPIINQGTSVLHITNDPYDAGKAVVGDAMISDARLAIEALILELIKAGLKPSRSASEYAAASTFTPATLSGKSPMTALDAFTTIAKYRPHDAMLLQESPSNGGDFLAAWPAYQSGRYLTFAAGSLGWNGPASVGVALAQQQNKTGRPTFLLIGDGSLHYSVQFLYTAVQQKVRLIILVPRNEEYAILKEFAVLENTPNVPALDIPGLDAVATARAYGCPAHRADSIAELDRAMQEAIKAEGPVLIEFAVDKTLRPLVAATSGHPK